MSNQSGIFSGAKAHDTKEKKFRSTLSGRFLEKKIEVTYEPGAAMDLAKAPNLRSVNINKSAIEKLASIIVKGAKIKQGKNSKGMLMATILAKIYETNFSVKS